MKLDVRNLIISSNKSTLMSIAGTAAATIGARFAPLYVLPILFGCGAYLSHRLQQELRQSESLPSISTPALEEIEAVQEAATPILLPDGIAPPPEENLPTQDLQQEIENEPALAELEEPLAIETEEAKATNAFIQQQFILFGIEDPALQTNAQELLISIPAEQREHWNSQATHWVAELKQSFQIRNDYNLTIMKALFYIREENLEPFLTLYKELLPKETTTSSQKIEMLSSFVRIPLDKRPEILRSVKSLKKFNDRLTHLLIFEKIPAEYQKQLLRQLPILLPDKRKRLDSNLIALSPSLFKQDLASVPLSFKDEMIRELLEALFSADWEAKKDAIFEKYPHLPEDWNAAFAFFEDSGEYGGRRVSAWLEDPEKLPKLLQHARTWMLDNPQPNPERFLLTVQAYFDEFPRELPQATKTQENDFFRQISEFRSFFSQ